MFHPSFNHPRQHFIIEMLGCKIYQCLWIFHYKNVSWDDSNCVLIRKECHKNTYHDDMKWHMTLNTIFSVVIFAKFGSVYLLAIGFESVIWKNEWANFELLVDSLRSLAGSHILNFFCFPNTYHRDVVKSYLANLLLINTTIRC